MKIVPFVMGSGRAADALKRSLLVVGTLHPEWQIEKFVQLTRGEKPTDVSKHECPILLIANPHGLHAQAILDATRAGFRAVVTEKPACVNLSEIEKLKGVGLPVAVCHGYRQMWGIQTLKQMIQSGEMGEVIAIEGRYWQSSAAAQALNQESRPNAWKNDATLSGGADVLIDIATHWVDAASFLMDETSFAGTQWLSYANAEAPHRDTHVHLALEYSRGRRALASISKTVHGATNHFEVNVLGTRKSATWNFLNPDEIAIGVGVSRTVVVRKDTSMGSRQTAFHGLGWLEGYVEIIHQLLTEVITGESGNYPALPGNLKILENLFRLKKL